MTIEKESRPSPTVPNHAVSPPSDAAGASAPSRGAAPSPDPRLSLSQRGSGRLGRQQLRHGDADLRMQHLRHRDLHLQHPGGPVAPEPGREFGWKFFVRQAWDPVAGDFGALPFIYGTLATSLLALLIAVPLALGVAIFITEMCPQPLRAPISFLTELLAAIPSVVYGLWAVFVLVPLLRDVIGPFLVKTLGWTGFFERTQLRRRAADGQHHSRRS